MLGRFKSFFVRHNRTPQSPQASQGTDSHPVLFRGVDITRLHEAQRKWMSMYQPLDYISVEQIRDCLTECTRGAYARQQWLWEQLEPIDPYMSVAVQRRQSALSKYKWSITPKADLDDADQALAEAQARTATDLCNAINNMDEAIVALGQASLRHYKFLQPFEDDRGLRLLPIDNWLMCRDGYRGEWRYNPTAQLGLSRGKELPVPYEGLVKRICPMPLDLPAQMSVLNRKTTLAQWDVFLGRYGVPPLFIVLPEGIDAATRELYIKAAEQCVSSAAGVLDAGSDLKSPTVPATSVELFDRRLQRSNEEIATLYTGGRLTMLSESGSGTLAGGAHQDTWDEIMAGEAEDIAAVLTDQIVGQVLDQYHPGQSRLIELTLTKREVGDPAKEVASVAQLRMAGYDLDLGQVEDRTGWEVSKGVNPPSIYESKAAGYVPTQSAMQQLMGMPMQPAPVEDALGAVPHRAQATPYTLNCKRNALLRMYVHSRWSTNYKPARETLERTVAHRLQDIDRQLSALTDDADLLARLQSLLTPPSMDDILADAVRIAPSVQEAAQEGRNRAATLLS